MRTLEIIDRKRYKNEQILLDDEDYQKVKESAYWLTNTKSKAVQVTIKRKTMSLANFILDLEPGILIDHIDRNPFNNQKSNFRICDHQQNNFNKGPYDGRRYKGVSYYKRDNTWSAQITKTYKKYHIGYFDTEIEAAKAYDKYAKELHGEFAYLNFPETQTTKKSNSNQETKG